MIRRPISQAWRIGLGLACVLLLAAWYTYESQERWSAAVAEAERTSTSPKENKTIPRWSQLLATVKFVCTPHERTGEIMLWEDAKVTFLRLFLALAVAVIVSVIVGIAMGCYAPVEAFLLPTLSFLAKIPPTAMIAVFFALLQSSGNKMYLAMLVFGTLPTLAQAVYQAAKNDVPEELVYKAYTIGAHHLEVIWNVIFPQIFPRILEAVRLQVGPAMVLLIAAEWVGTGGGFGYRIRNYFQKTDMTVVFVYCFLLGVAGFLIDAGLTRLRRKLCPWFGE